MRNPDRSGAAATLTRAARAWHVGAVVAVVAVLELLTGLPGLWGLAYPLGLVAIGGILYALHECEGGTVLRRRDTQHGNDMHGHY